MNGGDVIRCPRCGQPNQRTTRRCVRCGLERGSRGARPARPPAGPTPVHRPGPHHAPAQGRVQGPPPGWQGPPPNRHQGQPPGWQGPPRPGYQGPPPPGYQGAPPAPARRPARAAVPSAPASASEWSPTSARPAEDAPARRFDTAAAIAKTGLRVRGKAPQTPEAERVRSDSEVPAPMRRRVASTGLDTLLCGVLLITPFWRIYKLDDSWWPPLILLLGVVALVLVTVLRARSGRSLFSGLFGIRTIVGEPGRAPGIRPMVRRHLVSAGAFLAAGASMWSAFRDPAGQRRTWQDRAAGTRVIDTRWGADPLEKPVTVESEEDTAGGERLVVVAPDPGARRTRPGVLGSGLDMTPGTDVPPGVAPAHTPVDRARVAVIDAAERAAGATSAESPPVVVVSSAPERIAVRLVDDTGRSVALARSALIGRDPVAAPDEEVEHLFALEDPDRTVSKTHLRIDVAEHGVTVLDRGSSNGTTAGIGGADHALEPGVPLGVPVGTVLRLGERTVTVEAP